MLDRAFREAAFGVRPPIVPVEVSWTIARPDGEGGASLRALAAAMEAVVAAAAADARCIGAFAGAAGAAWDGAAPTPFEVIAGVAGVTQHRSASWFQAHARTPAWRAVIPAGALARAGGAEDLAGVEPVAAGLLVRSAAADPFSLTGDHRAALERIAGPAVGDPTEAQAFLRARYRPGPR
jgi:hypothetical protein